MKKDNYLVLFLKGLLIGLGIIFPISASFLAMGLGVYERLLEDINNFFKNFKKEFKFLFSVGLGIVISALISCILVKYTLERYPIATYMLFIGLILGGIPLLVKKTEKKFNFSNIVWGIIGILILFGLSFIGSKDAVISMNFISYLKVFGAGALAAGSMMIPGVSGSALLVIIGFYRPMLNVISNLVNFVNFKTNLMVALIFIIGCIIGVIIISKIMGYLLKKKPLKTYFAIFGFVLASALIIVKSLFDYAFSISEIIIGGILFIIGLVISLNIMKEE